MLDRPMNEDALERFGFGQPNCSMLLRVLQCQQSRSQKRGVRKVGMVIGKRAELDHGAMLPQGFPLGQNQKVPAFQGGLVKR